MFAESKLLRGPVPRIASADHDHAHMRNSLLYSGTQVDAEHKKNLYRLALGEQCVTLAEEVERLN